MTDELIHLDTDDRFEVRNFEERIIEGRIVPFNETINVRGRPESFAPGAFSHIKPSDVKLLRDHDRTRVVGKAVALEEREDGLYARFKIASTESGDEILQLASEGIIDSFSPGFLPGEQTPDGVHRRVRAMPEVSILPWGAYSKAKVLAVRSNDQEVNVSETQTAPVEEPTPLTEEDIAALQQRQDEMFAAIERLQATLDAPGAPEQRALPTPVEWFRAELDAAISGNIERRERFQEAITEALQTRALVAVTGGETQAGDNTPADDLSGTVVEQYLASQLVNVMNSRRPLFSRLGNFPAVRSGYVEFSEITQHTIVGDSAGQDEDSNSRATKSQNHSFKAQPYNGAIRLPLELIASSELPIVQFHWDDLVGSAAKYVEAETVAFVEAGGQGFTYTEAALDYTGSTPYKSFAAALAEANLEVWEQTDFNATRLGVPKALWIKLLSATDKNDRRQFTSGDHSDGNASLTSQTLSLPGGIEAFYVPGLTQAILFNEQAFRAADYGTNRIEALNVTKRGREIGLWGRYMLVPRIPSGIVVFGDDPESS